MGKLNINYIETTLNGYVIKRIKIKEWVKGKDYIEGLKFKLKNKEVDYYEDIAGDYDEIDKFLKEGSHENIISYRDVNHLSTKKNVFLEYWKTENLRWHDDKYVGLEISDKEEMGIK